jgi:nucleoside-triphosphatase THEP1
VHHQSDSPASLLASLFFTEEPASDLVLITGASGAGKTVACQALVDKLLAESVTLTGLISLPVFEGGRKVAIDLLAIHTGELRRLAALRPDASTLRGKPRDYQSVISHGRWDFDANSFSWGNSILRRLAKDDVLILDEIGPLEFQIGKGFQVGLALLDERRIRKAYVVVRTDLVTLALERWPWAMVITLTQDDVRLDFYGESP